MLTKKLFFIVSAKVIGSSIYWFKIITFTLSFSSFSSLSCVSGAIDLPSKVSYIINSDLEKTLWSKSKIFVSPIKFPDRS